MEGITGRSIHFFPTFSVVRCPFFCRGFEVNLFHMDMTMIHKVPKLTHLIVISPFAEGVFHFLNA